MRIRTQFIMSTAIFAVVLVAVVAALIMTEHLHDLLIMALIGVCGVFLLTNYILNYRRIMNSLSVLQAGTRAIGSGDLGFKIEEKKNDEIGDLSRAFNLMATNLKSVTASKTDLERAIGEHKKAEESLRQINERLEIAYAGAGAGAWDWDILSGRIEWSSRMFELFGLDSQITTPSFAVWEKILLPEDRGKATLRIDQAIKEHKALDSEYRIMLPDGQIRWISALGRGKYDEQGQAIRMIGICIDITERKRTEEDLAYLASFPEFNPMPVLEVDAMGKANYLNSAAKRLFPGLLELGKGHPFLANWDTLVTSIPREKTRSLVRDINIGDLWFAQTITYLPAKENFRIYCSDITSRRQAEEALRQVLDELEVRVQKRTRELEEANRMLKIEISERERAELAVKAERQQFNDVLDTLPAYLILLAPDYHVPFANRFFRERFGESHGKRCFEYLFQRSDPCEVCETYKVLKTMRPLEWEWTGPDGRNYYIHDFPFKDTDGSTLIMEVGLDITEQKQTQEALRKAHDELEKRVLERTAELAEANKELESFSYSVSHDLRAPLRSLDGFSLAVLEDYSDKLDTQGKEYLQNIRSSSQLMATLIDDILTLSRVVRAVLNMGEVNLSELAEEVVVELKRTQPGREVEFQVQSGLKAYGDRNLLKLVLDNLLDNAYKFTGKREKPMIEFGAKIDSGAQVYYVRDNGAGFDMAYGHKLFQPFQRLHSHKDFPGTGIGLASVQRILQRHGGRIWAEGEVGKGATFYFTLSEEKK